MSRQIKAERQDPLLLSDLEQENSVIHGRDPYEEDYERDFFHPRTD
jgi:hypothetical protein